MHMNISAASAMSRVIGPTWATEGAAECGHSGMRPNWAFRPARPVRQHGIRIEAPPSVPSAREVTPAAVAAPAPALEPPGVLPVFHGLRVIPLSGLSPTALQPNSLV